MIMSILLTGLPFVVALAHSPVVMFPKVSVSALTRHVKHCEGETTRKEDRKLLCTLSDCIEFKKIVHHICLKN